MKRSKKKPEHYVNNAEFLEARKGYKKAVNKAKKEKKANKEIRDMKAAQLRFQRSQNRALRQGVLETQKLVDFYNRLLSIIEIEISGNYSNKTIN